MKKHKLMEVDQLIRPSHTRISRFIYAKADQLHEAERILKADFTKQINMIREEYTALMNQVPYESAWVKVKQIEAPAPGELKL